MEISVYTQTNLLLCLEDVLFPFQGSYLRLYYITSSQMALKHFSFMKFCFLAAPTVTEDFFVWFCVLLSTVQETDFQLILYFKTIPPLYF